MNKDKYINDVLKNIDADRNTLKRIREDLFQRIDIAEENDPFFDVVLEIGHPVEVAKEFNENLELSRGLYEQIGFPSFMNSREFVSRRKLFGLPLIHVNVGGRYQNKVAKGIIAVGDVSIGVISFGGVALGGLSFGGVSIGLIALGGVAVGGVALGGVAVGGIALGGVAVGIAKVIGAVKYLLG